MESTTVVPAEYTAVERWVRCIGNSAVIGSAMPAELRGERNVACCRVCCFAHTVLVHQDSAC